MRLPRWVIPIPAVLLGMLSSPAFATNPIVTTPTDYWFEYTEQTEFVARTFIVEGFPSDPMLWLYDGDGQLLASNDDYFGLQSYLSVTVQAGRYRLRAGICCGDPNAWRTGGGWNLQYELSFTGQSSATTTTPATTSTSTTEVSTTSTTSTTTTTEPEPSSTTTSEPAQSSTTTTNVPTSVYQPTTSVSVPIVTAPTPTSSQNASTTSTFLVTTSLPVPTMPPSSIANTTTTTILPATTTSSVMLAPTTTAPVEPAVMDPEQALLLATDQQALIEATVEEAQEIFEALDVSELSEAQAAQLVEAVQNAPIDIREVFEDSVDLFSGKTDSYVPIGSAVSVGVRRAIIAVTGLLSMVPIPTAAVSTKR